MEEGQKCPLNSPGTCLPRGLAWGNRMRLPILTPRLYWPGMPTEATAAAWLSVCLPSSQHWPPISCQAQPHLNLKPIWGRRDTVEKKKNQFGTLQFEVSRTYSPPLRCPSLLVSRHLGSPRDRPAGRQGPPYSARIAQWAQRARRLRYTQARGH